MASTKSSSKSALGQDEGVPRSHSRGKEDLCPPDSGGSRALQSLLAHCVPHVVAVQAQGPRFGATSLLTAARGLVQELYPVRNVPLHAVGAVSRPFGGLALHQWLANSA
jgi:hypothetical protein